MVLMTVRLNWSDQYLAYRFNVHNSTVSQNFKKWTDVMYMYVRLKSWPGREELLKTMPMQFRKNFKACILVVLRFLRNGLQAWNPEHKLGAFISSITR